MNFELLMADEVQVPAPDGVPVALAAAEAVLPAQPADQNQEPNLPDQENVTLEVCFSSLFCFTGSSYAYQFSPFNLFIPFCSFALAAACGVSVPFYSRPRCFILLYFYLSSFSYFIFLLW